MNHGSLFSGIGGFDLAAEWMGWNNVFHCEWSPFGQKVLKHYWPNATSYTDITKSDFSVHRGSIDILTGGFPCQPFSAAGKRKGKEDDRYLWPEMLRVIDEVRPTWICGENVAGIVSMVQPEAFQANLETQASILKEDDQTIVTELREYVIETICGDLERIGYSVQPVIIPACATGAPHRRDRVWFIANGSGNGSQRPKEPEEVYHRGIQKGMVEGYEFNSLPNYGIAANADGIGRRGRGEQPGSNQCKEWAICSNQQQYRNSIRGEAQGFGSVPFQWEQWPTQSPVCNGNDGVPPELDGITLSKWRQQSIKAGGNAIVPQVAYQIFQAIEEYNQLQKAG